MSYTNNPTSIVAGTGITITPTAGTGANQIIVSTAGADIVTVRVATATPVAITTDDEVVSVEVPGPVAVAVTLPAGITGQIFYIKDGLGLASPAIPITVNPAAGTIDTATNATINTPFGSLTLVYSGTEWKII
jgi:hypothetical protein